MPTTITILIMMLLVLLAAANHSKITLILTVILYDEAFLDGANGNRGDTGPSPTLKPAVARE